mmetsp:Transcript_9573/g.11140  ORF Transcript_9573/g.11140 Transcript_9573/m.11140 type:complete len:217 (+) Transcript_9573:209-859(+)
MKGTRDVKRQNPIESFMMTNTNTLLCFLFYLLIPIVECDSSSNNDIISTIAKRLNAKENNGRRHLDISVTCREEQTELEQSEEFKYTFPSLSQDEFSIFCINTTTEIFCDLAGTSMVTEFQILCGDAGGKTVLTGVEANGSCTDNLLVTFVDFPICIGKSCDSGNFVESLEEKLKSDMELLSAGCSFDLTSSSNSNRIIHTATTTVALVGTFFLLM